MTRPFHPSCLLLSLLLSFTFCIGQTTSPKGQNALPNGQPKLFRTQGTNEYVNVHCALQDRKGDLWFGTTGEGVYRYDGKVFTQFTIKDGLNSNTVWSVLEDRKGNIWFGTRDLGLCRYDGKIFTSFSE